MKTRKPTSISRNLTYSLVLTVITASAFMIGFNYFNLSRKAGMEIEKNARESINYLTDILGLPLWNLNYKNIDQIGRLYSQNDLIVQLKIIDVTGEVLLDIDKNVKDTLIKRDGKVVYNGKHIGNIEISLTKRYHEENTARLFRTSIIMAIIIIAVLIVLTGVFLRTFLEKPLQLLGNIANSYRAGSYVTRDIHMSVKEFKPFLTILEQMGETIHTQMAELKNSEMKYRSIFENSVEGIFKTTAKGNWISVNPAMAELLGYDSGEDLMKGFPDIKSQLYVYPEVRGELLRMLSDNGRVLGFETEFYRKDQSRIWVELNAHAIFDDNGRLSAIEGFMVDITERKMMDMELRQAKTQLELRVRERTQDLELKTTKLERMNRLFIDRELRMKEIKNENRMLMEKLAKKQAVP